MDEMAAIPLVTLNVLWAGKSSVSFKTRVDEETRAANLSPK